MTEIFKFIGWVAFSLFMFVICTTWVSIVVRETIRFYFRAKEDYVLKLSRTSTEDTEQEFQIH